MKTALVFGSSGLVGQQLVKQLIHNSAYQKIKLFVRKNPNIQNPKIEIIETKFDNLEILSPEIKGDSCFFCIGTTKKNSPEKSEYERVELELPKKIANLAKQNEVQSFIFVSSGKSSKILKSHSTFTINSFCPCSCKLFKWNLSFSRSFILFFLFV